MIDSRFGGRALVCLLVALTTTVATAGQDDDSPFAGDGKTRNAADPIYFNQKLADFPMNAESESGLRMMPPTRSDLFAGQRFDLRVETQIPAQVAPKLVSLKINGKDVSAQFTQKIQKQGKGSESGTPKSELLFGETARNMSFDAPGHYLVEAVVNVDGKAEIGGQVAADLVPGVAGVVRAHHVPVLLHEQSVRAVRVECEPVDAVADLLFRIGNFARDEATVDRRPRHPAVVRTECSRRGDSGEDPLGV